MFNPDTQQRPVDLPLHRGVYAVSADAVGADQRRRLLEALPRAVAESGFEGTTVEHIVKLAQVRRNSFYEQFRDKHDCFSAAYENAQERLLGVLTYRCYTRTGLVERIDSALQAGLGLLSAEPVLANLLVIEAPAAGQEIAARHEQWLDRYSRMLQLATVDNPDMARPRPALEAAVVGGIVSRIKQLVLAGETRELPGICADLVQFTLSFYDSPEPSSASLQASAQREGADSVQPQSPERSALLEVA